MSPAVFQSIGNVLSVRQSVVNVGWVYVLGHAVSTGLVRTTVWSTGIVRTTVWSTGIVRTTVWSADIVRTTVWSTGVVRATLKDGCVSSAGLADKWAVTQHCHSACLLL